MADHLHSIGKVSAHLEKRRDYWHMVASWVSPTGQRKRKSKSTGLPVKGNKKRAEEMLNLYVDLLQENTQLGATPTNSGSLMLLADYLEFVWLAEKEASKSLRLTTLACYESVVKSTLAPYFHDKGLSLFEVGESDIEEYYAFRLQSVKATTVHKAHVVLSDAFKSAVKKNLVTRNVMDTVKRPKAQRYRAQFFSESEIIELFEAAQGHELELPIMFGAYYGLRRSEIVGLRWDAINFEADTISIEHTVTKVSLHGKRVICEEDIGKTKSSLRTLPLIPAFKEKLTEVKVNQQKNEKIFGTAYNKKQKEYIFLNPLGELIQPDYITRSFPEFLEKNEFRRIRFHDLRHSCASLLIAHDVPLIQIKDWLGHSEIGVTADIYGHLEYKSKLKSVKAMDWIHQTTVGKVPAVEDEI